MKNCPYCQKEIQDALRVCKQCGGLLHTHQSSVVRSAISNLRLDKKLQTLGILLTVIGTVLMCVQLEAGTSPDPVGYAGMVIMLLGIVMWGFAKFNRWASVR